MKKTLLTIASALVLVAMLAAPALASGTVVWELKNSVDEYLATGEGDDWVINSGNGAEYASKDGSGLKYSGGRPNDYSVIDLKIRNNDLFDNDKEYTLVASMKAPAEEELRLVTTSGYSTLVSQEGTSATLTYKFKGDHANIRFQTSTENEFTIVSAIVYEGDPPAPGSNNDGGSNPKTGDNTMIALAISALLLASGAIFVIARKVKA